MFYKKNPINCLVAIIERKCSKSATFSSTRMEVIQTANRRLHPKCSKYTIDLLSKPILSSSAKEYERKWNGFMEFAKNKVTNLKRIDLDLVINFLASLHTDKNRKASTISQYRTALTQPLPILWYRH